MTNKTMIETGKDFEDNSGSVVCPECQACIPVGAARLAGVFTPPGEGIYAPGLANCLSFWQQFSASRYQEPLVASIHDLAFDAYCMQHLEQYCVSAKSYAAHLARLCCGLEYNADKRVYAAIQRWLSGSPRLVKPPAPPSRGASTIAVLIPVPDPHALAQLARTWAESVWEAYAGHHDQARTWVNAAMKMRASRSSNTWNS